MSQRNISNIRVKTKKATNIRMDIKELKQKRDKRRADILSRVKSSKQAIVNNTNTSSGNIATTTKIRQQPSTKRRGCGCNRASRR